MSIFVSNTDYIAAAQLDDDLPIIAWQSILQISHITASSAEGLRGASNLWSPSTASFWQAADSSASIKLANPTGAVVDYIAFAKHNLGSAAISYTLYSSDDDSTYTPVGPARSVVDDSPVIEFLNANTKAFFKIVFDGGIPIIAHVRMGKALVLPQSIYVGYAPSTLGKVVDRVAQTSSSGQYLGQVITQTSYKSSLKQENIEPDFIRSHIVPFIAHANGSRIDDGTARGTFFFAWRPVDYPDEVIYAWTGDNIHPENQRTNGMMSFSFNMEGVA